MAESTMVASVDETGGTLGNTGEGGGTPLTGTDDAKERNEAATGGVDDVEDLLARIKGKSLRLGVGFVARALQFGHWRTGLIRTWFLEQSSSTTRIRLKAASLFGEWCMMKGFTETQMAEEQHPEAWLEECMQWIFDNLGSYELANTCKTGISALYRDWFGIPDIGKNGLVCQTLRSRASSRTPIGARRRTIWNIDILITAIRREGNPKDLQRLSWEALVGRVGVMLMIFTACRISDMFNISPQRCRWSEEGGGMMIAMKTKSGEGRLKFGILIPTQDVCVDPVATVKEYRSRISRFPNSASSFFLRENGFPVTSPESLSRSFLIPYIRKAGIPPPYTAYSIKKAVITSLFNQGYSKERVSSFTGHSTNSNTALKHYHDPTNDWLGHVLARGTSQTQDVNVPDEVSDEGDEADYKD
jgi:hypothetical protein